MSQQTDPDFNKGYEKGYQSKDYTWADGFHDAIFDWSSKSDTYNEGYATGERERVRDDTKKGN